jgi:hypothetical protein
MERQDGVAAVVRPAERQLKFQRVQFALQRPGFFLNVRGDLGVAGFAARPALSLASALLQAPPGGDTRSSGQPAHEFAHDVVGQKSASGFRFDGCGFGFWRGEI